MTNSEKWHCPKCGSVNGPARKVCHKCKTPNPAGAFDAEEKAGASNIDQKADKIILTTAPLITGYRITETLEIITAECVFGMNVFRDFFAGVRDFFGGRSAATQKVLRDARKTCLNELKKEAAMINGDAVIAVDLDYSEISGGKKSMLFLVASGTAVKLEKES